MAGNDHGKRPGTKLPLPGQVLQVLVGEDNKHPI
jgi:hypothetical protein